MDYTKPIELGLAEKLRGDPSYRNAFFRAFATDSIALQIRRLRKLRDDMKQAELAKACGMKQSAVSRIEQADYSAWTFNTLWRVAEALGARLIIKFEPIEEAIRQYENADGLPLQTVAAEQAWKSFVSPKMNERLMQLTTHSVSSASVLK